MHLEQKRVVITGIGAVSSNGIGADAFAEACIAGRSGVSALRWDAPHLKSTAAAQVLNYDSSSVMEHSEARRVPRMIPMALQASREAIAMAGVAFAPDDIAAQQKIGRAHV